LLLRQQTLDINSQMWATICCKCCALSSGVCKVKSFPSHMGPWGGADLRFL